jgi:hypothetical protein
VYGCENSHKICYPCFEFSCQVSMDSKEFLKCTVCDYQLSDGEINQMRISADKKRTFREFQHQQTFSAYASQTKSVVTCPNQGCRWIAEAVDINERIYVQCSLCQHEFCSLCGQQYHYRTTCQEISEITQRWYFWCSSGKMLRQGRLAHSVFIVRCCRT